MHKKIEQVKAHLKENKKVYIAAGITSVVSVAATVIIMKYHSTPVSVTAIQKGYTITGDVNNIINQIVEVSMSRPGPKAFVVQCLETQKTWPSIRSAAKDLGVGPSTIAKHISGELPDVKGLHFEKLAEI